MKNSQPGRRARRVGEGVARLAGGGGVRLVRVLGRAARAPAPGVEHFVWDAKGLIPGPVLEGVNAALDR